jgi:hypothetical protein
MQEPLLSSELGTELEPNPTDWLGLLCVPQRKVRDCGPVHRIKGAGTAELNGDIGWKRRCDRQKTINIVRQIAFVK